eukprot:2110892-Rhodomonas_salina.2
MPIPKNPAVPGLSSSLIQPEWPPRLSSPHDLKLQGLKSQARRTMIRCYGPSAGISRSNTPSPAYQRGAHGPRASSIVQEPEIPVYFLSTGIPPVIKSAASTGLLLHSRLAAQSATQRRSCGGGREVVVGGDG